MDSLPAIVQAQSHKVQRAFILFAGGLGICDAADKVGLSRAHVCSVKTRDNWDALVQTNLNAKAETIIDSFADEALGARRRALAHGRDIGAVLGLLVDQLVERDESGQPVALREVVLGVDKSGEAIMGPMDPRALNALASALNSNFRTEHVATGEAHREKQELASAKGSGPAVVVINASSVPSLSAARNAGLLPARAPSGQVLEVGNVPSSDPLR